MVFFARSDWLLYLQISRISKIQLVVYYQCYVLIG